jgi:hypothetical protein
MQQHPQGQPSWRGQTPSCPHLPLVPTFDSAEECRRWTDALESGSNPAHPSCHQLVSLCVGWGQIVERLLGPRERMRWPGSEATYRRVLETVRFLYDELRCGVYVLVKDNAVQMFVPFVNPDHVNSWHTSTGFRDLDVGRYYAYKRRVTGYDERVNLPVSRWWANSGIVCNVPTPDFWSGTNLPVLKHLLETAARERRMPSNAVAEFCLNKRDFPHVRRDGTRAQSFLYDGGDDGWRSPSTLLPILSGYVGPDFSDFAFPLPVDWMTANSGRVFPPLKNSVVEPPIVAWGERRSTAFFRGSCTGAGTTPDTNQRLRLVQLAHEWGDATVLDAELTGWNMRDKKTSNSFMGFVVPSLYPFSAGRQHYVPMSTQTGFKYIVYVDGHSAANRYGSLLAMGCVILRVASDPRVVAAPDLWFFPFLQPGVDHLCVRADLRDLREKIEWCQTHDAECERMAACARLLWETRMRRDGILDHVSEVFGEIVKSLAEDGVDDGVRSCWADVEATGPSVPPSLPPPKKRCGAHGAANK